MTTPQPSLPAGRWWGVWNDLAFRWVAGPFASHALAYDYASLQNELSQKAGRGTPYRIIPLDVAGKD